jgi:hypothetical protein
MRRIWGDEEEVGGRIWGRGRALAAGLGDEVEDGGGIWGRGGRRRRDLATGFGDEVEGGLGTNSTRRASGRGVRLHPGSARSVSDVDQNQCLTCPKPESKQPISIWEGNLSGFV